MPDTLIFLSISRRFGHENISTAILPLLLKQEEHLSVSGDEKRALNTLAGRSPS